MLYLPCRSAFTEEFKDAKGFGWTVDERPPFNWKELIAKKVRGQAAELGSAM